MGFDFTVSVIPNTTSLDRDLQYVKSALLYADKVRLISPLAYLFVQCTAESNGMNEKTAIRLIDQVLPLAKLNDMQFYNNSAPIIEQLSRLIQSKRYRSLPFIKIIELKQQLKKFALDINNIVFDLIGVTQCNELNLLIKNNQVIIEKFDSSLGDTDEYTSEFFRKLRISLMHTYPLFDEMSNNLMSTALASQIVHLTEIEKRKIAHAGLADNYIQRLPSFEQASVSELLDAKAALSKHVTRFRSKMINYSEGIKSLPWDDDFAAECQMLFDKEVAPAITEIEESARENKLVKHLGKQFLNDDATWKTASGWAISIAAPGVISTLSQVVASDISAYLTASTLAVPASVIGQKLYKAYLEHNQCKKQIEKNDLFFYFKAGQLLGK